MEHVAANRARHGARQAIVTFSTTAAYACLHDVEEAAEQPVAADQSATAEPAAAAERPEAAGRPAAANRPEAAEHSAAAERPAVAEAEVQAVRAPPVFSDERSTMSIQPSYDLILLCPSPTKETIMSDAELMRKKIVGVARARAVGLQVSVDVSRDADERLIKLSAHDSAARVDG